MVAIEYALRLLNTGNECSVYNILVALRKRRYLACQTAHQYLYVHRAILAYLQAKKVCSNECARIASQKFWPPRLDCASRGRRH